MFVGACYKQHRPRHVPQAFLEESITINRLRPIQHTEELWGTSGIRVRKWLPDTLSLNWAQEKGQIYIWKSSIQQWQLTSTYKMAQNKLVKWEKAQGQKSEHSRKTVKRSRQLEDRKKIKTQYQGCFQTKIKIKAGGKCVKCYSDHINNLQ